MHPAALVFLCYVQFSGAGSIKTYKRDVDNRFSDSVCALDTNETLNQLFHSHVRQEYGADPESDDDYYTELYMDDVSTITCYGCINCPQALKNNATWCVHVYDPDEEVKVCINATGVASKTVVAAKLKMDEVLYWAGQQNCGQADAGCLTVLNAPYYFRHAYAVCIIPGQRPSFVEIDSLKALSEYVRIVDLVSTQVAYLKNRAILKCSVTFSDQSLCFISWTRNGTTYTPLIEDPFCTTNCTYDPTPGASALRRRRVRAYNVYQPPHDGCAFWKSWTSYLIIDNLTLNDSGEYACSAWNEETPALKAESLTSQTLVLQIVEPATTRDPQISRIEMTTSILLVMPTDRIKLSSASDNVAIYMSVSTILGFFFVLICLLALVVLLMRCHSKTRLAIEVPALPHNCSLDAKNCPLHPNSRDAWEFPREKLHIFHNRLLGKGAFGKVMKAQAEGIVPDTPDKDIVAVKTVKDNAPPGESSDLLDELELMKKIKPHRNVINLLGCCTTPGDPICLIIEYAAHGNLRTFLRSCEETSMTLNHQPLILRKKSRTESCSSASSSQPLLSAKSPTCGQAFSYSSDAQVRYVSHPPPLLNQESVEGLVCVQEDQRVAIAGGTSTQITPPLTHDYLNCKGLMYMEDIVTFALQIASGLQHLESMEIVHCDLAARNILISDGFVLKISDFGMARDISGKSYYQKSPEGRIPVKWTAPEALEEHLYTFKSDVWSFGIVLWEIFNYGHSPFPNMDIHTWEPFIQFLKMGNRPIIPDDCPKFFCNVMRMCWQLNPDLRPSSCDLCREFNSKQVGECLLESPGSEENPDFLPSQGNIAS
eukprot:Em0013g761a